MNIYTRIYNNLVNSRKGLREQWEPVGSGLERHRIVPGHIGGTYDESNCTYLTHREHIIAHWLLWKIYGRVEDWQCSKMMAGSSINAVYMPGVAEKISEAKKGKPRPDMYGKAYFGANSKKRKEGIEKMRMKKIGMKINYPKNRKSSPCSPSKAKRIKDARLNTKKKFINMSDDEFAKWVSRFTLFNEKGKINGNITRAMKWRGIDADEYIQQYDGRSRNKTTI